MIVSLIPFPDACFLTYPSSGEDWELLFPAMEALDQGDSLLFNVDIQRV